MAKSGSFNGISFYVKNDLMTDDYLSSVLKTPE